MKLIIAADEIGAPGSARFAAWLEARTAGIGASEIPALLNLSNPGKRGAWSVYLAKRGEYDASIDSARLRLGRVLEPFILDEIRARVPKLQLCPGGLYQAEGPGREWQLATFDALAYDALDPAVLVATVQCKTTASWAGFGDEGSDQVPSYIYVQCVDEIDVAGVDECLIPVMHLPSGETRLYWIRRDGDVEIMISVIRAAGADMMRRVVHGDPPPPSSALGDMAAILSRDDGLEDRAIVLTARQVAWLDAAKRRVEQATERLDELRAEIAIAMGNARWADSPDGQRVAHRERYPNKRLRPKLVREMYPRVADECTTEDGETNKLVVHDRSKKRGNPISHD